MKALIVFLLIFINIPFANPMLNINAEKDDIYFEAEGSPYKYYDISTIKPLSIYRLFLFSENPERLKPYTYIGMERGIYIKPINEVDILVYSTDEENFFIEGSSGIKLKEGFNYYTFLDGFISGGDRLLIYYQLTSKWDSNGYKGNLFRGYGKIKLWKFSLLAGKDNVNLGPGEYGLLLSNNTEPYPMIKIQTEEPLKGLGYWDIVFVRGWLIEKRQDRDNPSILALRVVWKPFNFIEIGGTKTTLYEGEGRPKYRLDEYLELIFSTRDNITGGRYDNSSNAGYDISLYLPLKKIFPSIKIFKIYYQEAASDVIAFWQEEDRGTFYPPFGIRFLKPAYQGGILMSTGKNVLRLEFAKISDKFFIHHYYPIEGHTYKGLSLGYPYGRNSLSVLLKHRYYPKDNAYLEYKIGGYKRPFEKSEKFTERFFLQIMGSYTFSRIKGFIFLRADKVNNYDRNPLPNLYDITDKDRIIYTVGGGIYILL